MRVLKGTPMKFAVTTTLVLAAAAAGLAGCGKDASTKLEGRPGASLTLKPVGDVTVRRGEMEKVKLSVKKEGFNAPVRVHFSSLPRGVEVVESSLEIVGDDGEFTLRAGRNADLVENHVATVSVEPPNGQAVSQNVKITVKEAETAGNR
jgi:hypothetical protein